MKFFGAIAGITATGRGLDIDDRIGGAVQVIGQSRYPVYLTSLYDCQVGAGYGVDGYTRSKQSRWIADFDFNGSAGRGSWPRSRYGYVDRQ